MKNERKTRYKSYGEFEGEGKGWWYDKDGRMHIKTRITDDTPDLIGDIIARDATIEAMTKWIGNIRLQHDANRPIGKTVKFGETDDLEWNEIELVVVPQDVKDLVEEGVLKSMSVGIIPLEYVERNIDEIDLEESPLASISWFPPIEITKYEFVEVSIVDNPMHPNASFTEGRMKYSLFEMPKEQVELVLGSSEPKFTSTDNSALYLRFGDWDEQEAIESVTTWASSDGSGDEATIDWDCYRKAFFVCDMVEPEKFESYMVPYAKVVDGELVAVWDGMAAAEVAVEELGLPEDVVSHVKSQIVRYEMPAEKETSMKDEKGAEVLEDVVVEAEDIVTPDVEDVVAPDVEDVATPDLEDQLTLSVVSDTILERFAAVSDTLDKLYDVLSAVATSVADLTEKITSLNEAVPDEVKEDIVSVSEFVEKVMEEVDKRLSEPMPQKSSVVPVDDTEKKDLRKMTAAERDEKLRKAAGAYIGRK